MMNSYSMSAAMVAGVTLGISAAAPAASRMKTHPDPPNNVRRVSPPVTGRRMGSPVPKGHPGKRKKHVQAVLRGEALIDCSDLGTDSPVLSPTYDVQAFHAQQREAAKKARKARKKR